MGYVMVKELQERSGDVNSHYQRTYTRTFLVETDDPAYGPYYAASHPTLPVLYSPYPEDPYAFCTQITPSSTESPTMWKISYRYAYTVDGMGVAAPTGVAAIDTQQQGLAPADRVENPLLRPRDYSFATQATRQNVVYKAYQVYSDGSLGSLIDVANAAGDPVNPPFELDVPIGVITVGLNALSAPGANWIAAFGQCNLNSVLLGPWLCAAGTLRNRGCSAQRVYENNLSYWRWTLTFEFRDTWDETILERGLRARPSVGADPLDMYDPITKRVTTVPLPLDSDGTKLPGGRSFVYTTWRYITRVAFPSPL